MKQLVIFVLLCASFLSPVGAATFVIRSIDSGGEGLNDPTPFTPIGGNNATTLGEARMNVLREAGRIWGEILQSNVPISVDARFDPRPCTQNSGSLAAAGPRTLVASFPNAPTANVLYAAALANSLAGSDRSALADVIVTVNSGIGSGDPNCLPNGFYFGFDHNRGGRIDLLSVLLHEFGHGLGFASEVDNETGEPFTTSGGVNVFSSFVHRLFDESLGRSWPQMTNAERAASATLNGSLAWNGPRANAQLGRFVMGGTGAGRLRMYAPTTLDAGSSVSHWDTLVFPDVLMEPFIRPVTIGSVDITACALEDIGWSVTRCPDDAPTNVAPVANAQSVTTAEDTPIVITLTGADANNDPLSFAISAAPSFGTLSPISPVPPRTVTYTPGANLNGMATFAFVVSDATSASSPAVVSITVTPVNDAPIASPISVSTTMNQSVGLTLSGSDIDGSAITFAVLTNPVSGNLSGTAPNLTYQPNTGFVGTDTFTYRVSDGSLTSQIVSASITVTAPAAASAPSSGGGGGGGGAISGWQLLMLALLLAIHRSRIVGRFAAD